MLKFLKYTACLLMAFSQVELSAQTEESNNDNLAANSQVAEAYVIGPGDVLSISVWKEEDMQVDVLVKPDGGITFALVGDINVSNMSTSDLTIVLEEKLRRFIPNPVVTVSVLKSVSNKIYVVGKVSRPGEYISSHYMDVLQALSLAGGLTPFAESDEIKIMRRSAGGNLVFEFDYDEVVSGDRLDMNIILKAGDTVVVP